MIRNVVKHIPGARKAFHALAEAQCLSRSKKAIEAYLGDGNNKPKRLHLGCGNHLLGGWLNSDYYPRNPLVVHIDATKTFPLPANSFEYVFSEHMIEHISYIDGLTMLAESCRILKSGGKIRISTPNLKFLIDLYSESKSQIQTDYIHWSINTLVHCEEETDALVINNFVRDWGHQFIYDHATLRRSLERCGFVNVEPFEINESKDDSFRNLENESRMPAGFLRLETITLEATKP
jgi:predicted SAM-dependent methyltransferase